MSVHAGQIDVPASAWIALGVVVVTALVIDLVGHRGGHGTTRKSALLWSVLWVSLGCAFGGWVTLCFGSSAGEQYFTAFLVEKSLSVDNLFVFLVIFGSLKIPTEEQHRVLSWGIFGAFVTRGLFIFLGGEILRAWHPIVYVLGAFLVYTGIQTVRSHGHDEDDEKKESRTMVLVRRFLPVSKKLHGHHFVVKENGRTLATPLLFALLVIEVSDVLFAVDSIPAVFAITEEPFIVYASNIFAVLGLRALYSVLADVLDDLKYLHYGLAGILAFTGLKMLVSGFVHVPNGISLAVIAFLLVAAIVPSLIARKHEPA